MISIFIPSNIHIHISSFKSEYSKFSLFQFSILDNNNNINSANSNYINLPSDYSYEFKDNYLHLNLDTQSVLNPKDIEINNKNIKTRIEDIIEGLTNGHHRTLEIKGGAGYKGILSNNSIQLNLGYSHDIIETIPEDITITDISPNGTKFIIKGINKNRVSQYAHELKRWRPYKPRPGKDNSKVKGLIVY